MADDRRLVTVEYLEEYAKGLIDQNYTPDSENAQSGKAVAEAVATEQKRTDNTFANALKSTKSDTAMLLDDVSPVTHEMGVRVRSKNLLNLQGRIEAVSNGYSPSTIRTLTGNQLFVGFSSGNHWLGMPAGIASYSIEENKVEVTTKNSSYGIGFDISLKPGTNYKYSYSTTEDTSDIRAALYTADGVFTRSVGYKTNGFTTTEEEYWAIIIFNSPTLNKAASYTNIQLEENSTATDYTPYVPDLTAVKVSRCGKNILEYPYVETTLTRNGITFTDNGDGTITANGTATADTQFRLQDTVVYPDNYNPFKYLIGKTVAINGSPDGSSKDTYAIQSIQTGNYGNTGFTISNSNRYRFAIFIKSGITVSNLVFKPMIYLSGVTNYEFEQYSKTDYTPTADGTVEGVTSLYPNTTLMTDTDGVIIDCEYNRDINKAFAELQQAIISLGGNV